MNKGKELFEKRNLLRESSQPFYEKYSSPQNGTEQQSPLKRLGLQHHEGAVCPWFPQGNPCGSRAHQISIWTCKGQIRAFIWLRVQRPDRFQVKKNQKADMQRVSSNRATQLHVSEARFSLEFVLPPKPAALPPSHVAEKWRHTL